VTVFVDTSAILALVDGDDGSHHCAARTWVVLMDHDVALWSHNYVQVETNALLQRRLGMEALQRVQVDVWPIISTHWITPDLHRAAVAAQLAARRRKLSLVDCVSFEVMRHLGIRNAFAFDRHFKAAGFTYPTP